jgi:hypothetical protein
MGSRVSSARMNSRAGILLSMLDLDERGNRKKVVDGS